MPIFEIKHRVSHHVLWSGNAETLCDAVLAAIRDSADLSPADLHSADLSYADLSSDDLSSADLHSADLRFANLSYANLSSADLRSADLHSADLCSADLRSADLRSANLCSANLHSANLRSADLRSANLCSADLRSADLSYADLSYADLRFANLQNAMNAVLPLARTVIVPAGTLIVWKKCQHEVLVKLRIPEHARRSNACGRKCRAEFAEVLEVVGADHAVSLYKPERYDPDYKPIVYRAGETVRCDSWNDDRLVECGGGVHFYLTREEAEA